MTKQTKQIVMLVALLGVLGVVVKYELSSPAPTAAGPAAASNVTRGATPAASAIQVADVNLDHLKAGADSFAAPQRDPFRYRPKPAPPPPVRQPPPVVVNRPPERPAAPVTPAPRPIPLKYLGYITLPGGTLVAYLHDGSTHPPLSGKQGDVIEGQYRLLRVDANFVEMSYLDGTGSRRINKTGQ